MSRLMHGCMVVALCLLPATAEDFYVSQLSQGSGIGASCSDAIPVSFLVSAGNWGSGSGAVGPGDVVHLCGTISTPIRVRADGTSSSKITIKFETGAKMSAAFWTTTGAINISGRNHIIIDGSSNGVIEATDNGTNRSFQEDAWGISMDANGSNLEIKRLTIRNLYVTSAGDSRGPGIGIRIRGGSNIYVHDNTIFESRHGINAVWDGTSSNWEISNNNITRCGDGIFVGDANGNDSLNGLKIHHNEISGFSAWYGTWTPPPGDGRHHVDAIQVASSGWRSSILRNLEIYSNYIHEDVTNNTTAFIFPSGEIDGAEIHNNVLEVTGNSGFPSNGLLFVGSGGQANDVRIYNNTIVTGGGGGNGIGAANNIAKIHNNIIKSGAHPIFVSGGGTVGESNYNRFIGGTTIRLGNAFVALNEWQANYGNDVNSEVGDIEFGFRLRPVGCAGTIDRGSPLPSAYVMDFLDRIRPAGGQWDIGAYEDALTSGCESSGPQPPTNLRIRNN